MNLSLIDTLIIGFFFISIIVFSIYQNKGLKKNNNQAYFLANKNTHWIIAMLSIVATETSVLTFVGIPAMSSNNHDWSILQLVLGFMLGRIIVSQLFISIYYKEGVVSIYQIIGDKFGVIVQKTASVTFLITRLFADGVRFLATASIVHVITGWDLQLSIVIIGVITIFYTSIGGLKTILWVDGFQFFIYLSCGLITIFYIIFYQGIEFAQITNQIAIFKGGFNLSNSDSFFIMVFSGALISIGSHGVDYLMVQRVLSTKNITNAKKAMIGSGVFVFIQFCVFLLVGSLISTHFEPSGSSNNIFAEYIKYQIPVGLKGLMIAGVLSAAMSSLSSSINSMASSTIIDILNKKNYNKSMQTSVLWGVTLTLFCLFIKFDTTTSVVIIALQIASFTYGSLIGLFLLSKLSNNFSTQSVICGYIGSILILLIANFYGLKFTYFIAIGVVSNFAITYFSNFYWFALTKNKID